MALGDDRCNRRQGVHFQIEGDRVPLEIAELRDEGENQRKSHEEDLGDEPDMCYAHIGIPTNGSADLYFPQILLLPPGGSQTPHFGLMEVTEFDREHYHIEVSALDGAHADIGVIEVC